MVLVLILVYRPATRLCTIGMEGTLNAIGQAQANRRRTPAASVGQPKARTNACLSVFLRKQPRIGVIQQLCETTCCLARQWACCVRHGSMPVGASRFTWGRATWRQRLAVIAGAANRHACPLRPGCAWVTHHTGNAHNNFNRMRARDFEACNFKHLALAVNFIELCALR
jgi:hypothetical protein